MPLRCFMQEQAPVPGSAAQPVRYPACAWVEDAGEVDLHHPLNRFVCAWFTSDVNTVERCQEVLDVLAQVAAGQHTHWAVDGDAFTVDVHAQRLQFNFSHVGPNDSAWWNLPEGCLAMDLVHALLRTWCQYLQTEPE